MVSQLKERDELNLLIKNLKICQKNKKPDYINLEPFFIKAKKRIVSFKPLLPKNTNIHPISHILLLDLANPKTLIPNIIYYQV